jgi:outer membrane protein assembly factor BamA
MSLFIANHLIALIFGIQQRCFLLPIVFILWGASLFGQVDKVYVRSLNYEGLKKTKRTAVKQSMNIHEGDSISLEQLMPKLEENRRLIMNSRLFSDAELKVVKWDGNDVDLILKVHEAWYVYPIPIFELADRNFNVWWRDFDHDIDRVNLGLAVYWRNLAGYNDLLRFITQFGYTRKFEIDYSMPPIGLAKRWGFGLNVLYSDNKEIACNTVGNKLLFYRDFDSKERQFSRFRAGLTFKYRQSVYDQHVLGLQYLKMNISDSVYSRNPDFFLDKRRLQRAFNFDYEYRRDKRDIMVYPLKGYFFSFQIKKRGLGIFKDINQLWLTNRTAIYQKFGKRWSLGLLGEGRYSVFRHKDPYYQQEALGYLDSYVRAYQYYVINGQDYLFFRSDLNFKILDYKIPLDESSENTYSKSLPIHLHARLHADYGYVWDRYYSVGNPLSNNHLVGMGVGLDLALYYYNLVIQMEYSINKLWEKDVFLKFNFNF